MEDYHKLWDECLTKMQPYVKPAHLFDTWFRPVKIESYDPDKNIIMLCVPSVYVYEYIETYQIRLLTWAVNEVFKPGASLRYRILQNACGNPVEYTIDARTHRPHIKVATVPDGSPSGCTPAALLRTELSKHVSAPLQWLPAYDNIAWWLSDNKGRGLLCMGASGLGKTVICTRVLPAIIQQRGIVQCNATDMARRIDELLKAPCVIIDDLGKEDQRYFGNTDKSFFKLCNAAVQEGKLLIITTNLTTMPVQPEYRHLYPESIQERYGHEVLSRLRSLVLPVFFEGQNMWA